MTAAYDPALRKRLCAEARAIADSPTTSPWREVDDTLRALADQHLNEHRRRQRKRTAASAQGEEGERG